MSIVPAYAQALKRNASELNTKFLLFQQSHRAVNQDEFMAALKSLLEQLPEEASSHAELIVVSIFDKILEIALQDVTLKMPRTQRVFEVWQSTLPNLHPLLIASPEDLLADLANATLTLSQQTGTRFESFLAHLNQVSSTVRTFSSLRSIIRIAAWMAGMASIRSQALTTLESLSSSETAALLPQAQKTGRELASLWHQDVWVDHTLGAHAVKPKMGSLLRTVGGFVGFGGPFFKVPRVQADGDGFLVSDGLKNWRLDADVFGTTWTKTTVVAKPEPSNKLEIENLGDAISVANSTHTQAVTIENSLRVYLFSRSS